MDRPPGPSVRLRLTLSYAAFLMVAGALLLAVVWVFLLRYVPERATLTTSESAPGFIPLRSDLVRAFVPRAAEALAALLAFSLVGGWILAGRMLAPLTRIAEATRVAGTGSLGQRIRLPGRRDEFRDLADAFDAMFERIEAQVAEQGRFAANASHELRTPLSITQTLLDVARREPGTVDRALLDQLHVVNARAIGLTEALLVLSRADGRAFVREPVDLSLLVEEVTETLLPFAERRGVLLETSGTAATVSGSPALLLQVATNLVHNAIVHNLDDGGRVSVTTTTSHAEAVLVVENTGETLTPQLVATLREPFRRGRERIHTDDAGVGLGLAIVSSIVGAHDGTVALRPRQGGGLRAEVRLPSPH